MGNSDMIVRFGQAFPHNPIGIGRNVTQPPNWDDAKESNIRKEYEKYNCSTLEAFELRLSTRGTPFRSWVRCYRVSWFLTNGWYSPALKSRLRELDKWPPPAKYTKEDWLSWTQADRELNKVVLDYCSYMRARLKDTVDSATANDFRKSKDPMDKLIWHLRAESPGLLKSVRAPQRSWKRTQRAELEHASRLGEFMFCMLTSIDDWHVERLPIAELHCLQKKK